MFELLQIGTLDDALKMHEIMLEQHGDNGIMFDECGICYLTAPTNNLPWHEHTSYTWKRTAS